VRPVNLIPADERRGQGTPTRTGPLVYVVLGGLVVALLAVVGMVTFSNRVADREREVAALEKRDAEVKARAQSLSAFITFQQIHDTRTQTLTALAQSRFDWERVLRELSMVLPERVWLVNVTGTAAPEVQVDVAAANPLRGEIDGPALELVGCARSQRDVARLISAIGDIDGVTRVTAAKSAKPTSEVSEGGSTETTDECRTRNFITKFELIAAFDAIPAPPGAMVPPPQPEGGAEPEDGESTDESTASDESGVGDTQAQRAEGEQELADSQAKAKRVQRWTP
jgi:Tfp pilus assembly protein PilN